MENNKEKIQSIPKNLKINTRIVLTSVLAITIPIILIVAITVAFLTITSSQINSPAISSASYNMVTQLKWNQAASDIAKLLEKDIDSTKKLSEIKNTCEEFEEQGAIMLITENSQEFYKTESSRENHDRMNQILSRQNEENSYSLSESGLIITASVDSESNAYRFVILNNELSFPDFSDGKSNSIMGIVINRASIIVAIIALLFIIAIVVSSLITTKTIVGPIRQITEGANEIAAGNFEHEIEYKSTNELGQLAESFNDMRLRVKASIEEQSLADQKQKEMIAGIAHDLRTPLTSVKGYLEGLRDGIADTPEKQKKYMDIIYSSTCDTEKMLDELLTISKLELGSITLNCEKVLISDFTGFAAQLGEELEKQDFDFEIIDKTKGNTALYLDTDSFSRVITNIISNSVKYRNKDIRVK